MRVATGVEFDEVSTEICGGYGGGFVRIHEQTDQDAGALEARNLAFQGRARAAQVEPAFGGELLATLGHDAGLVGADLARDRHHFVGRCNLEIQQRAHRCA